MRRLRERRVLSGVTGLALVASVLAGCEEPNIYVEPPPPQVSVAQPLIQNVTDYLEFTGTTGSSARVDVRARVSGILESMSFEPGASVDEGDLLFVIDRDVYEADYDVAKADLAQAEAAAELARVTLDRMQQAGAAVSRTQVDEAAAEGRRADAEVLVQKARLRQAEINLDYTEVQAPITGRVGRNLVDVGNLVGEGEATKLTDITAYDPMYVYFSINEQDLLRVLELYRESGADPDNAVRNSRIPLYLGLANERGYPHEGLVDFADSGVDTGTGTLQLRGIFPNRGSPPVLLPGLFARVRLPIAERPDMPLVSERAIGADQSGRYVLVMNNDTSEIEKRSVELGQLIDGLQVIEDGVRDDDWIVVNGLQRARPGAKVQPEVVEMATLATSAMRDTAASGAPGTSDAGDGGSDAGDAEGGSSAADPTAEP